jgi:hypothetical protein
LYFVGCLTRPYAYTVTRKLSVSLCVFVRTSYDGFVEGQGEDVEDGVMSRTRVLPWTESKRGTVEFMNAAFPKSLVGRKASRSLVIRVPKTDGCYKLQMFQHMVRLSLLVTIDF